MHNKFVIKGTKRGVSTAHDWWITLYEISWQINKNYSYIDDIRLSERKKKRKTITFDYTFIAIRASNFRF